MLERRKASDLGSPRRGWTTFAGEPLLPRPRDVARSLGVSEAELIAIGCGDTVTRLAGDWRALLTRLGALGPITAVTRNAHALIETRGVYGQPCGAGTGLDLRCFFDRWRHAFAVREPAQRSLAFFDAHGRAVHEVVVDDPRAFPALEGLVTEYTSADQSPGERIEILPRPPASRPDAAIDVLALHAGWDGLREPYDFTRLLHRLDVTRPQALRLAGRQRARAVALWSAALVLERVSVAGLPIMVLVPSPGTVQIRTGLVHSTRPLGPWLNVLDGDFTLHLRGDHVCEAWVAHKPSRDGLVSSLELFDSAGELIALVSGPRTPGQPEDERWHDLLATLPARG